MHLLTLTGITFLFLMPSIQQMIAGVAEQSSSESSVCIGKIGELYCRTWEEFVKVLRHLLDDCKSKAAGMDEDFMSGMQQCLKNKTVASLDRMLRSDVIPLVDGLELVRYISNDTNRAATDGRQVSGVDEEWRWQVLDRVAELFRSHVIRLRLEQVEGRGRHHYKHLFPLMMFAFMKMLVILVPLGFQFMAVISGKALLLSKMALALASAQAMKKVTSAWFDVYHAPHTPYYHHLHRSYHTDPGHSHHLDFFNTPPLQTHFQGFQPTLTDLTRMPSVASAAVVQAPQHQDASFGHNLAQVPIQQDHQPAAQEYQFVFPGGEHQGMQYPQIPSVYDPAEGLPSHGEERLDKKYGNRMNQSYQRNRNKKH